MFYDFPKATFQIDQNGQNGQKQLKWAKMVKMTVLSVLKSGFGKVVEQTAKKPTIQFFFPFSNMLSDFELDNA